MLDVPPSGHAALCDTTQTFGASQPNSNELRCEALSSPTHAGAELDADLPIGSALLCVLCGLARNGLLFLSVPLCLRERHKPFSRPQPSQMFDGSQSNSNELRPGGLSSRSLQAAKARRKTLPRFSARLQRTDERRHRSPILRDVGACLSLFSKPQRELLAECALRG